MCSCDVSYRRLEHRLGREVRARDLQHVLLEDEVRAPQSLDVLAHCGPEGAEVVEAGDAAVDLEGGKDEEFALEEVFDFFALVLLGEVLGGGEEAGLLFPLKRGGTRVF